jgi:hypothetical protein
MKTRDSNGEAKFVLRMRPAPAAYLDAVYDLENLLATGRRRVTVELIGTDEMPPDIALTFCDLLRRRQPGTELVTHARSSLLGSSILLWLLGDRRTIREDAVLFFDPAASCKPVQDGDQWDEATREQADVIFEDVFGRDLKLQREVYAKVVQIIDQYLPVRDLAGKFIDVVILRQFGLLEDSPLDQELAAAFEKTPEPTGEHRASPNPGKSAITRATPAPHKSEE